MHRVAVGLTDCQLSPDVQLPHFPTFQLFTFPVDCMSYPGSRPQVASAAVRRRRRPGGGDAHAAQRDRERAHRACVRVCRAARVRQDDDRAHSGAGAELREGTDRRARAASATPAWRSRRGATSTSSRSTPPATPASTTSAKWSSPGLAIAPVRDRYKMFIIDEVHQLSAQSFNALLKSIEEPPAHVVFMMATTELHKIPDTILSRSQVFEFRAISGAARSPSSSARSPGRGDRGVGRRRWR